MNIAKSIKIALVQCEKDQRWLANKLSTIMDKKISRQQISNWCSTGRMRPETLEIISKVFNLKVSQFLALGED